MKIFAVICLLGAIVIMMTIRLTHPDMSETRLFLEFWPAWLVVVVLACLWSMLARRRP